MNVIPLSGSNLPNVHKHDSAQCRKTFNESEISLAQEFLRIFKDFEGFPPRRHVFDWRQSTDKQDDVTGVSTVSFTGSFPQILRSLQRSSLCIQPSLNQNAISCVSYLLLSRS
jgi:hypothetical protein